MKRIALFLSIALLPFLADAGTASPPHGTLLIISGTPTNGTNEIQTITFGSGQASGTFFLRFNNQTTPAINWSATNATLVSNIDSSLETLSSIGTGGVTTAVGTMTAGIGTITVTFTGRNAKLALSAMTVPSKTTSGTIAVSRSTPGVTADGRTSETGTLLINSAVGGGGGVYLYINTGSSPNPIWLDIDTGIR